MRTIPIKNRVSVLAAAGLLLPALFAATPVFLPSTAEAITVEATEKYGEEAQLVSVREATIALDATWEVEWDEADDTVANFSSPDGSIKGMLLAGTTSKFSSNDSDRVLLDNFDRTHGSFFGPLGITDIEVTESWRDNDAFFAIAQGSNMVADATSVMAIEGDQMVCLTITCSNVDNGHGVVDDIVNSLTICGTRLDASARFGLELVPSDKPYTVEKTSQGQVVGLGETAITIPASWSIVEGESYGTYVEFEGDGSGWIMAGTSPTYSSTDRDPVLLGVLEGSIPELFKTLGMTVDESWRSGDAFFAVAKFPEGQAAGLNAYQVFAICGDQVALASIMGDESYEVLETLTVGGVSMGDPRDDGAAAVSGEDGSESAGGASSEAVQDGDFVRMGGFSFTLPEGIVCDSLDESSGSWTSTDPILVMMALCMEGDELDGLKINSYTAPILMDVIAGKIAGEEGFEKLDEEDDVNQVYTTDGTSVYTGLYMVTLSGIPLPAVIGVAQAADNDVLVVISAFSYDLEGLEPSLETLQSIES